MRVQNIFQLSLAWVVGTLVASSFQAGWAQEPAATNLPTPSKLDNGSPGNSSDPSNQPNDPQDKSSGKSQEEIPQEANSPPKVGSKPKRPISEIRRPTKPTDAESLEPRPPKPKFLGSSEKQPSEIYDLTFDDLAFEIAEGEDFRWSMLTPEIHQYDGAKIKLRGYIRPSFSNRKLKQFVFVRDNQECCFGPGAALFDCVLVQMAAGKETDFTVRPVTLEGEFYLRKYAGPDGNVWAIYRLKNGQVR